jgi:hypothetical protein
LETVGPIVRIIEAIKIEWLVSNRGQDPKNPELDLTCRFLIYTNYKFLGRGTTTVMIATRCVEVDEMALKLRISFKTAMVLALGGSDALRESISGDIDTIPVEKAAA